MPCTWKGYGEPLPLLPINTGEKKKTREDFFGEKREASYRNKKKKKRKRKQTWGGKNRDYGLCTGKKKNRPHPLGTTAVSSSPPPPVAPRATASRTKKRESGRLALAREEREKEQNIRGKKQITERRTVTSLSGLFLFVVRNHWPPPHSSSWPSPAAPPETTVEREEYC
jgi:hypothetical protein